MTRVTLSHVTKRYTPDHPAVKDLSLTFQEGELTALLGPSGCGKTTVLKMIAGLLQPTAGDLRFDDESVLSRPAERRGAVMVFQNHLLFPHLNVQDNVAFGLKMARLPAAEVRRRVGEMLELVQLTGFERRKPAELSGGQQQRVALARALVVEPRVLLLDEPLANLDAHLREEMRELIRSLQRRQHITTVFVTHDQQEAVMVADRLALMIDGRLQQVGNPYEFYNHPQNLAVARFFGARNIIPGTADGDVVETGIGRIYVRNGQSLQGRVHLVVRPEHIRIVVEQTPEDNLVDGVVRAIIFTGSGTRLKIDTESQVLEIATGSEAALSYQEGDPIQLNLPAEKIWACLDQGEDV